MTFYQDLKKIREKLALKTEELLRYSPTAWQTGDTITAVRLNNMENGIDDANDIQSVVTPADTKAVNSVAVISYINSLDANNVEY